MKEKRIIQYFILIYWTLFGALSVVDKIIPDVSPYWVGADFYTLFIKFFASLGLTEPIFATIALAAIALIELFAFVCYSFSLINFFLSKDKISEQWFYRGILCSVLLFSLFSIGDQIFGDRTNLLEHSIFWIILICSWVVFKYTSIARERVINITFTSGLKFALVTGILLLATASYSIINFSKSTYTNKTAPVQGEEVVKNLYKFDIPFLGDKSTMETTIKAFEKSHIYENITYIYTGPDELNSKKKTHLLLYVFTEQKKK